MLSINKKEEENLEINPINRIIENIRALGIDMIREALENLPKAIRSG